MLYRMEGIVIRTLDYGEGNKIVTIYTAAHGKLGFMARGAKKLKSRHSAVTQLFTYGEYVFYKSSAGGLGSLNQGEIIEAHHKIREMIELAAYAAYLAEMIDRMTEEGEGSHFLYEQLKGALAALEEGKDPQILTHLFESKMLAYGGYAPVLDVCVNCGSDRGPYAMSSNLGGILCGRCLHKDPEAIALLDGTYRLMTLFAKMDIRRLGNIDVKPETKAQLKQIYRRYMDEHVGIAWKARSFLDQMEKYSL